ncbi:mRNA guanylyltransferase [Athelia psychrophila]|uniref:mRNA guanylyltransferase n=1 Tax=Athelia psychrophila TaxID=1759441 RepID=A0A166BE48_9AGAM|nr:mRNA guanylyltransferase [Fibularhizoctonia sp. CBS 109695]
MVQISELPGTLVTRNSEQDQWVKGVVVIGAFYLDFAAAFEAHQLHRFPGKQPVSFRAQDLDKLESQDFWVCEKPDGMRVLLFVNTLPSKEQLVYIIDRHNSYRQLDGFVFPHHMNTSAMLGNTIVDGELNTMRFLAFDCLVVDNENVMTKNLEKRYGRLKDFFHRPYAKMMRDYPHMAASQPFHIKVQTFRPSYHVGTVFTEDIPALQHGNDGLIYTCVTTPYVTATDHNVIKWKPPSKNSIDFKLVLQFPPSTTQPNVPDLEAMPFFALHVFCGDDRGVPKYEPFDELDVGEQEWETLKQTGEQIDDRIVEVYWERSRACWRMMRFRDDKPNGNFKRVVDNIMKSIEEGVEKEGLRRALIGGDRPPAPARAARHPAVVAHQPLPYVVGGEMRYGPLGPSKWSKVAGPLMFAGLNR